MNLVVFTGNLTKDPEIKTTAGGAKVATLNIAVNRTRKKEGSPDSDFFRIAVFGKMAELCEKYLAKGKKVGIQGRIENNNYEKEGQKVYQDSIIANNVEFLSPALSVGSGASTAVPVDPAQTVVAPAQAQVPGGFSIDDDEYDLPF